MDGLGRLINGWKILFALLLFSQPVAADGGFRLPCTDSMGNTLEVEVSTFPIFSGRVQVTSVEYLYFTQGPDSPPSTSIIIQRHFYRQSDIGVRWRIVTGSVVGPLVPELPELPIHWQLRLIQFSGCTGVSHAMRVLVDWGVQGDKSLFVGSMDTMFAFLDSFVGQADCWVDFEYLLGIDRGIQNGAIRGLGTPTAQRDGVRCVTANPIAFFDGSVQLSVEDLVGLRRNSRFGHRRSYVNQFSEYYDGPNGANWVVHLAPYLVETSDGELDYVVVIFDGNRSVWFQKTENGFLCRFGEQHVRLHRGDDGLIFTQNPSASGAPGSQASVNRIEFHGLDAPLDRRGLLKQWIDSSGIVTEVDSDDYRAGQIEVIKRILPDGTEEKLVYDYPTDTPRRLEQVTYFRRRGATSVDWIPVSRAVYTYYNEVDDGGSAVDLKTVTNQQWLGNQWRSVAQTLYRYWKQGQTNFATQGFRHGLKFVVGPAAYQRMIRAGIEDPSSATDDQLALWADHYFAYDPETHRVTREIASAGCLGCATSSSGGTSGDTFEYQDNSDPEYTDDFNHWKRKITVSHGDGFVETVYMNHAGLVMMRVYQDEEDRWAYVYQYDKHGRQIRAVSPSAVNLQSLETHENHLDLVARDGTHSQYIKDNAAVLGTNEGLILITEFDEASGQINAHRIQQGQQDVPATIETFEYDTVTVNGQTRYPIKTIHTFPIEGGEPTKTEFSIHEWHERGTQVKGQTVTLPGVGEGQNGSGKKVTVEQVFDIDGNVVWHRDERGSITQFIYRPDLNLLKRRIDDVDMTRDTLEAEMPSWSTPFGGGRHLTTDFEYDQLGRLTGIRGPVHKAVVDATAKNVRFATWFRYQDNGVDQDDQIRIASGYVPSETNEDAVAVVVDPITVNHVDKAGQITQRILSARAPGTIGPLSDTEDLETPSRWRRWVVLQRNARNLVERIRSYHEIAPSPILSAPDTDTETHSPYYSETLYGYDKMGRNSRVVGPDGTITRFQYDGRGRVKQMWIGTNDACDCDTDSDSWEIGNMVLVALRQYDRQDNLIEYTRFASDTEARTTRYTYDWRNRLIGQDDGSEPFFRFYYDNLDRNIRVDQVGAAGELLTRREQVYDNLGRIYRSIVYAVDPASRPDRRLTNNTWYDAAGNVIKIQHGGSKLTTKIVYDTLGRPTATYFSFNLGESHYAEAGTVVGDTVLEQIESVYDNAGHIVSISRSARGPNHSRTTLGRLSDARTTYQAFWYDGIGRLNARANYGTAGGQGQAWVRPDIAPMSSGTALVSRVIYNDRGQVDYTIDPAGHTMRFTFDDAGRLTQKVENDGNLPSLTDLDTNVTRQNRVTQFTYWPNGQIRTRALKLSGDLLDQVTTYIYGVSQASGSELASNGLLRAIIENTSDDPFDLSGPGDDEVYDRVEMKYNRLGQPIEHKDQRGVVRTFDFDSLGRLHHDRVVHLGVMGSPDRGSTVRRITRSYNARGLVESIVSHRSSDGASVESSDDILNEVNYQYNGFGRLVEVLQSHEEAVDKYLSPRVS